MDLALRECWSCIADLRGTRDENQRACSCKEYATQNRLLQSVRELFDDQESFDVLNFLKNPDLLDNRKL